MESGGGKGGRGKIHAARRRDLDDSFIQNVTDTFFNRHKKAKPNNNNTAVGILYLLLCSSVILRRGARARALVRRQSTRGACGRASWFSILLFPSSSFLLTICFINKHQQNSLLLHSYLSYHDSTTTSATPFQIAHFISNDCDHGCQPVSGQLTDDVSIGSETSDIVDPDSRRRWHAQDTL